MKVDIRADISAATSSLANRMKQTRFAASRALNAVAAEVVAAERETMQRAFDRPTPFTLNSLRFTQARRDNLETVITPKDSGEGGRSAAKWLGIEAAGGPRRATGAERALRAAGILPNNRFVVPSVGAELDVYGNWRRSQLTRILLDLRAGAGAAPSKRLSKLQERDALRGRRTLSRFFVLREYNKGLKPGIYERRVMAFGQGVRPVVLFSPSAPRYQVRLPFGQAGRALAIRNFEGHFERELAAAMRTAR